MDKLNICLITRYPPFRGGTSSVSYWTARRLGELGHKVHVVTNSARKGELKNLGKNYLEGFKPKNVKVHCTNEDRVEELSSLAVKVIKKNDLDLIDARYLFPFGLCGFIAKTLTKKPLVVKHAGSDMIKYFDNPLFRDLFLGMLKNSNLIITNPWRRKELLRLGINSNNLSLYSGIEAMYHFFNPEVKPAELHLEKHIPVITCIGKICNRKEISYLFKALGKIREDFILLLIPERDSSEIKNHLRKYGIENKAILIDYQPPWNMPSIYSRSTMVVCIETGHLPTHLPLSAFEAFYSGRCVIISEETYRKSPFRSFKDGKNIIVVDPKGRTCRDKVRSLIKNPEYAKGIGLAARRFYLKQTYCEENFNRFLKTYYNLIK